MSREPEAQLLLPDTGDPETAEFWKGTALGELRVQMCADCGQRRMPPRPMCYRCRSLRSVWEPLSGRGSIWSFVVPHPPLLPAYEALAPYNVIVVATVEDASIRFAGNLVESADGAINAIDPATIRIGEAVRVVFAPAGNIFLPRWVRDHT